MLLSFWHIHISGSQIHVAFSFHKYGTFDHVQLWVNILEHYFNIFFTRLLTRKVASPHLGAKCFGTTSYFLCLKI